MKPTQRVIDLAIRGNGIIPVGKLGAYWDVYKRAQTFSAQQVLEPMFRKPCTTWTPFSPQWIVDYEAPLPPLLYRAEPTP